MIHILMKDLVEYQLMYLGNSFFYKDQGSKISLTDICLNQIQQNHQRKSELQEHQ